MVRRFILLLAAAVAAVALQAFTSPEQASARSSVVATATHHCSVVAATAPRMKSKRTTSAVKLNQAQRMCVKARPHITGLRFWYSKKHRWMLYLNQAAKKCWHVKLVGPMKLCMEARASVRLHTERLLKLDAKIKMLLPQPQLDRGYLPPAQARLLGQQLAAARGWVGDQWRCLDTLWGQDESGWSVHSDNPNSDAYGIPQANPGSKMASFGRNWLTSAYTQIKWGLKYIYDQYKTPCGALDVENAQHAY